MRKFLKVLALLTNIFVFIFFFISTRCIFLPQKRPYYISRLTRIFAKAAALIIGIKIKIHGNKNLPNQKGIFFVTNHVSYLDGIIISSIFPLVFIARGDLKQWPLFGIFTLLSDTIFVNRLNPSGLHREIGKISSFLTNGINVILFPEGTTTDGNSITPFKSSFFEAPLVSGSLIVPFTIKYRKINTEPIDEKNKDLIFWYGDMDFVPHLLGVLALKSIEVDLSILKPIEMRDVSDRKELSSLSKKAIETHLTQ
ncbi:MAG: lysophospholipid acyltransferase family protein [Candidatus Omnitrophota bacterium]|nr:lysophospholipid acyltransferase family protein [Candidatus Omnitrophota bacterium]